MAFNLRIFKCFEKYYKKRLFWYGKDIYLKKKLLICEAPSVHISYIIRRSLSDDNNSKITNMQSKEELRSRLTVMQYEVTQNAGTERPFSGCYDKHFAKGVYQCIVCHQDLFSSDNKYDSGCGWPAFNDVVDEGKVELRKDCSLGMERVEVRCSKCSAHMGHVFDDGPKPKRRRFCINSAAIDFVPNQKDDKA